MAWGSPYGATVVGYDDLHPVHRRLQEEGAGGPRSRYEIVHVAAVTDDVVVAQVRRVAHDADNDGLPAAKGGAFSEMALYVIVERDGDWWLAAGQNTPIRPAVTWADGPAPAQG